MNPEKPNQTPTLIQQTLQKSMFTKTRSNSVGAIPKTINVSQIPSIPQQEQAQTEASQTTSWQFDRVPIVKRKRSEVSPPQTENAKKKQSNVSYTIPTQNQFEILDNANEDTGVADQVKIPKPEPIFVTGVIKLISVL